MPDSDPHRRPVRDAPVRNDGGEGGDSLSQELTEALEVVLSAVRAAGEIGLSHFRRQVKVKHKPDGSPVTEVDLAIDALLRQRLLGAFPQDGWLSEEGERGCHWLSCRRAWVVDPLDGTGGYLRGEHQWCVAVALLMAHQPVLGVIHAPALGHTWWATAGEGAFRDGERIYVSTRRELAGSHIIGPALIRRAECWDKPWPEVEVRRYPSLALRLAYVAEGRTDAMLAIGRKNYWDVAAGDIIVREAGGLVSDVTGAPLRYDEETAKVNGVIAAPRAMHVQIRDRMAGFRCGQNGGKRKRSP